MDIKNFVNQYNQTFLDLINKMEAHDNNGNPISYQEAIGSCMELVNQVKKNNKKIIIIGNGGSAGIASHQAVDYWKNGGVRAIAFNDSSLLTCISNDYSYDEVFAKPIEMFADEGDLLLAISSSGASINILNAVKAAENKGCQTLTFSGFNENNPLRKTGKVNFYVPAFSYGYVEILHLFIIHSILDAKLYCHDEKDVFNKNLPLNKVSAK